jgi:hypothetical protein
MGWKNVKEHYRIGHIVQVTDQGLCIGSTMCHDLIVIDRYRGVIKKADASLNADLMRYVAEMRADPDKLRELLDADDTFEASIPVWTCNGSEVKQAFCEKFGYPNVTHDGEMMWENTHLATRAEAVQYGIREAEARVKIFTGDVARQEQELSEKRKRLGDAQADLAKLRHGQIIAMLGPVGVSGETGEA